MAGYTKTGEARMMGQGEISRRCIAMAARCQWKLA